MREGLVILSIIFLFFVSCTPYQTKAWHAALNHPIADHFGTKAADEALSCEMPPRGPDVSIGLIHKIHIGQSAEDLYRVTGNYPYWMGDDYAAYTTYNQKQAYEVAFRFRPKGADRIIDISYLPVTETEVQKSRGP